MIFTHAIPSVFQNKGSTFLGGTITSDGQFFVNVKQAEYAVWDINSPNNLMPTRFNGDFLAMRRLSLIDKQEQTIIVSEHYGRWQLKFIDIQSKQLIESPLSIAYYSSNLLSFSFSPSKTYFALAQGRRLEIYNWEEGELVDSIRIEHCIKRAEIAFVSEKQLAVRTDYGCLSIYQF